MRKHITVYLHVVGEDIVRAQSWTVQTVAHKRTAEWCSPWSRQIQNEKNTCGEPSEIPTKTLNATVHIA